MSWFDKLFGEDNDSSDDLIHRKKKRQSSLQKDNHHDSLLPQNNDIYNRPRGKFRFPMNVNSNFEQQDNDETTISEGISDYRNDNQLYNDVAQNHKRHRRRRSQLREGREGSKKEVNRNTSHSQSTSKQHSKNHDNDYYFVNKIGTYISAIDGVTSENKKQNDAKATTKANDSTVGNYHKESFRTSEVPSAIFGTMKPKKLENGRIPTSKNQDQSNETANVEDKAARSITAQKTTESSNQSSDNSLGNDAAKFKVDIEQPKKENSTKETPNYSKVDNTINIENIYASQIVEEIRRERERKILQKRRFKKALQQKREQHNDDEQDSIQKAIDEMYARQAEQYIGESSLDTDVSIDNDSQQTSDEVTALATNSDIEHNNEQIDENPNYDYEEVSLADIDLNNKQQLNDEDVTVKDIDTTSKKNTEQQSTEINKHNDILTTSENNSKVIDDNEEHDTEDVDDADYYELNDQQLDGEQLTETQHDQGRKTTNKVESNSKDEHSTKQLNNHDNINNIDKTIDNEIEFAKRHKQPASNELNDNSNTAQDTATEFNNKQQSVSSESSESRTIGDQQNEGHQSQLAEETTQDAKKTTDTTTKRPFNVVMTPSDKKRMMDKKKHSQVSVPELKPVQRSNNKQSADISTDKYQADSNMTITTYDNNSSESLANTTSNSSDELEKNNIDEHSDVESVNPQQEAKQHQENVTDTQHTSDDKMNDESQRPPSTHDDNNTTEDNITDNATVNNTNTQSISQQNTAQQTNQSDHKVTIRKGPNIKLPSVDLLEEPKVLEPNEAWIDEKKQELNDALYYFNVPAEVQEVTEGPSVTRFELSVEKGVKVSRITALQDDIKMALAAKDIRIEAPIPGTSRVGIEVPNQNPTKVNLRSIIETPSFKNAESKLTVAMGYRINNEPLLMDIAKTPHALIAGATGSGKSVCINSILMSLLYKNHPEELRLLLIDPKMVELAPYNGLPHLVSPVITDVKAATQSLKWAVEEMERRYKLFAHYHVRNITAFNKKAPYDERMPKIVIVIDELADLMMMAPQEVEQSIARIAQKARACGIHMLVATQRPSVNVITGLIKANIPTRIAFMVSSSVDSRTILDSGGAERLLGYGDMLYLGSGMNKPIRVQGTFVSDDEIDDVVDFIKQQREPDYLFEEKELLKKQKHKHKMSYLMMFVSL
ncbi:FtsK/SpoIIIE family protein [Staphylococcus simiae CCM 7213 = CCUG 51256]|uniref:FtsK/SpoIIIE family protein n=1 Tax=Staphylococcus simiae CCM 7213 = CCUG 51256 TaxID=911238 RepID=G5JHS6_9STAP|nr:FtsK/SpoIIIE family protein [Staphylococcus simiae CCM 7213 = CCUG 51256]